VRRTFAGRTFNEFTLEFPRSVKLINHELLKEKIIGPYSLGLHFPELTKNGVVCVTETTSREEIERFAAAIRKILGKPV
jgi:glycine dehydrogenase subunit 1